MECEIDDKTINKAKNVIDFYVLCNKLKDLVRTGWKTWNVDRARIESVAEHIYGLSIDMRLILLK